MSFYGLPCQNKVWLIDWLSLCIIDDLLFWNISFYFRIEKRNKFSRRRAHYDDTDIDYINERNKNFNKKLARYYDPFTAEIKQNLERGTAV